MGIGAGSIPGRSASNTVMFRPGDGAYVDHTDATFHSQGEVAVNTPQGEINGRAAHYEILSESARIAIDVGKHIRGMRAPLVMFHSVNGEADVRAVDSESGVEQTRILNEAGSFNLSIVDVSGTGGALELTGFEANSDINGIEADWLPYCEVADAGRLTPWEAVADLSP